MSSCPSSRTWEGTEPYDETIHWTSESESFTLTSLGWLSLYSQRKDMLFSSPNLHSVGSAWMQELDRVVT